MTSALAIFTLSALLSGGFAILCMRAGQSAVGRVAIVGVLLALLGVMAVAGSELLGRPKPYAIELHRSPDATLIAWTYREGVAIWVWAQVPGDVEPRSYRLPWSERGAEERGQATDEAGRDGTGRVILRMDYPPGEPMAYAEPQPPNPPKDATEGVGP